MGVGCLRILEIGTGCGNNLKYYPKNTRLIALEPNENMWKHFHNKLRQYPYIILENAITGSAEDMSIIDDNTIDVIVSTHVLCSVCDIKKCLKEIKRVLSPNGRFIYVEHVAYESGTLLYRFQSWIEYLWKLFNDDCRLTLQTSRLIRETNFTSINEQSVVVKDLFITLIRPHIFGIAYK
ncbi:putative methyltransferase-like protein 7A [Oppia nitens]|uniref:putative methyltransferase-like protein 7A n=1 Tax=Oppia nitens TaxID=1686743 RepID=UPI0023DA01B7|nr:putative methyltransferase-like protein 7A [Oppia nitens]